MFDGRKSSRIRSLRKDLGYSQEVLANELNIKLGSTYKKSAVSKWESGKTKPPKEVLEELESMSGVRFGYLLESFEYFDQSVISRSIFEKSNVNTFQMGYIKLPIFRIIGGDMSTRYTYPAGILTEYNNSHFIPPQEFLDNFYNLLRLRRQERPSSVFEQRNLVRLDDYNININEACNKPWPLILKVSQTDFFTTMVTNRSLESPVPGSKLTYGDIYAKNPLDFVSSELANPLIINLSIITQRDRKIYVAFRSNKVATNPGSMGSAVSGMSNQALDFNSSGKYDPFITAQRESYEEVTGPYKVNFDEITFFGLGRSQMYYMPFLFGEIRLDMNEDDLLSLLPQDNWDVNRLISIPFTLHDVISYIKRIHNCMVKSSHASVALSIFTLYQSLIYEYPDQWKVIQELLR